MKAQVQPFFHAGSNTFSYVVSDPNSGQAAIIDPVLDFDAASARTGTTSAQAISHRKWMKCSARVTPASLAAAMAAASFFIRLQQMGSAWIYLGATKTGMVYRLNGNPPQSHE